MSDNQDESQELFDFIEEQIAMMKEASKLGTEKEISFFELETALKSYTPIYLSLLSLQNFARLDAQKAKERFDSWFSEKYVAMRAEVNKPELTAQKWAGQREIEHMVIAQNKVEYLRFKNNLLDKEHKLSFLNNLIDLWKSHQFILSTLSSNVRSEAEMSQ